MNIERDTPKVFDPRAESGDPHPAVSLIRPAIALSAALAASRSAVLPTASAAPDSHGSSAPAATRPAAGGTSSTVSDLPISFTVKNVNRSAVPCASDGQTYTVRGHLVGPAALLSDKTAPLATLYLHGLSFGEFFWHFQGAVGYDYATRQAQEHQQVSVVVDRIGYVGSDKPTGTQVCVGSRADMAHQMVKDLRRGSYQIQGKTKGTGTRHQGPRFPSVVLAGHSYGGQIAQVEAYSFGDIDGLVVLGTPTACSQRC